MSPPSKRVKPDGRRRTYFFKPEDSLTTNQEEDVLPLAQSTGLQNSLENTMTPTRPRKRVSKITETLRNRKLNGLSSDDMVFWQGTPKSDSISSLSPDKPTTHNLPSSPTRRIPISNVVYDPIGELAEKYNTTFDNLASQTPITSTNKMQRRSSDSQPASRKKVGDLFNFEHSPSIRRTKTAGLENLVIGAPVEGKIGVTKKFEKLLDEFHQSFSGSPVDVPISSKESTKSPGYSASEQDQSGFSDELDMDDINHLLEMTQPKPKVQIATPKTELPVSKDTIIEEQDSSFDNTSDDDDFEMLFNQLESQNSVKKLSTQEKKLRQSDMESVEIFQRHIKQEYANDTRHSKCKENKAKLAVPKKDVFRYQVVKIRKAKYKLDNSKGEQLILTVSDACSVQRNIVIRDFWAELDIEEGDVIHIIGKDPSLTDKKTNILIWNPDLLLSSTLVSESISCKRRSFIKNKLTFPGESSIPLIVGVIVHTVFQQCLAAGNITDDFISTLIEGELNANLFSIFSINESRETVREKIQEHVPFIKQWHDTYIRSIPVSKSSTAIGGTKNKAMVSASNILDIEENIWSPVFGLRGLIDVTVEACIKGPNNDGRFVVPLELKTGSREYISHRAQVSLYSLLVRERYDIDSDYFFLVFTKLKSVQLHNIKQHDLRLIVQLRNELSGYLKLTNGLNKLPPLIKQSECDRCDVLVPCMALNKLIENGTPEDSGILEQKYELLTSHLDKEEYKSFFKKWVGLIDKESLTLDMLQRQIWTLTATEKEQNGGTCLGGLEIIEMEESSVSNYNYRYVLNRDCNSSNAPLTSAQFSKYDRILVSDEEGHYALAVGCIDLITPTTVIIRTDRRIVNSSLKLPGFNARNNQTFQSVLSKRDFEMLPAEVKNKTFRIDKNEFYNGLALARFNILNLFLPEYGDEKRRRMVVELKAPSFSNKPLPYNVSKLGSFNPDQLAAVKKALCTEDYSLILGMPGTGKTTVIAQIIRIMVANGKSVLLTSHTHSAVDNILLKLLDDDIDFYRVGSEAKIHPLVRKFMPQKRGSNDMNSIEDFQRMIHQAPVVAATCMGVGDLVFNYRTFDYCIVDEASQVSMPFCLGPLRFCDKFILVGDHFQLPPLVKNPEARNQGLDRSLFKILSEKHPQSVVSLSYQYRMCADVMLLSNKLIYENRLKCGSDNVAQRSLRIPMKERLDHLLLDPSTPKNRLWLHHIFVEENRVIFLDHDDVPAKERMSTDRVDNPTEAELVGQIVDSLINCGCDSKEIGVMSFYRAQVKLMKTRLVSHVQNVEVMTADQFQGRDKECIIISLVRSNATNSVGNLLKEWRRINVAITRAKSKLLILGSRKTLEQLETLKAFLSLLKSRGWIYRLPLGADSVYKGLKQDNHKTEPARRDNSKMSLKMIKSRPILKDIFNDLVN
ncbi:hypothetical protein LJB42_001013 [Komagataella kurtzmanii]|nr:hypothetical protein LJB42_001013 [Komagataella kurtzmanii]